MTVHVEWRRSLSGSRRRAAYPFGTRCRGFKLLAVASLQPPWLDAPFGATPWLSARLEADCGRTSLPRHRHANVLGASVAQSPFGPCAARRHPEGTARTLGRLTWSRAGPPTGPPHRRVCGSDSPLVRSRGADACRAGTPVDRQPIRRRGFLGRFLDRRRCRRDRKSVV